jgi:hypothetical protein
MQKIPKAAGLPALHHWRMPECKKRWLELQHLVLLAAARITRTPLP